MNVNATAVDWGVVIFMLTAATTLFAKWILPALLHIKKGSNGNGGGPATAFELGRMEQILEGRTSFFENIVSDQRRIAEEQSKIATLLDNVHRIVGEMEERGRGQADAIKVILAEATVRDAQRARVKRRRGG